jgi:hypothetical protein
MACQPMVETCHNVIAGIRYRTETVHGGRICTTIALIGAAVRPGADIWISLGIQRDPVS